MRQRYRQGLRAATIGLLVALPGAAQAQEASDPRKWAAGFFDTLMQQNVAAAFRVLKEESFLGQQRPGALGPLEEAMTRTVQGYGTIINYEQANEARLGATLVRLTYLVNHRVMAVQYQMILYKGPRGWNLVHVDLKDKVEQYDYVESRR
jgi:hypothetical protein